MPSGAVDDFPGGGGVGDVTGLDVRIAGELEEFVLGYDAGEAGNRLAHEERFLPVFGEKGLDRQAAKKCICHPVIISASPDCG